MWKSRQALGRLHLVTLDWSVWNWYYHMILNIIISSLDLFTKIRILDVMSIKHIGGMTEVDKNKDRNEIDLILLENLSKLVTRVGNLEVK